MADQDRHRGTDDPATRRLVREVITCPCCGQHRMTYRAAAADIGIGTSTLFEYLAGGSIDWATLARIRTWLARRAVTVGPRVPGTPGGI
jgi:hypothetical protein